MIPEELQRDLDVLSENGFKFEAIPDNPKIYIIFSDFPLPEGLYNADKTTLLIFTTPHYPIAGFDMFWTDPELKLKDGNTPKQAEAIEQHRGQSWRRFSYHPYNNAPWNPSEDTVARFIEYVQQRLRNGD